MSTSNPNIHLPENINALNFKTKLINGVNYRVNNFNYKDLNIRVNRNYIPNNKGNMMLNKDRKMINLDRIKNILSDDDKTSEDEYSDNFSFDDEEANESHHDKFTESNASNIDIHDPDILLAAKELRDANINQKWSHFFAIPFNVYSGNKELVDKFNYFRSKIIDEGFIDINENLFQVPERLHMTLCLLELKNNNEINKLKKTLKELIQPEIREFVKENEIYSFFDTFEVFGKPHESRVLYAKPENSDSDKLFDILDILFSNLIENKIINKDALNYSNIKINQKTDRYEKDKLHLTIMNSTFAAKENLKNNNDGNITIQDLISGGNKKKVNCFFNGLRIIKRFNNFHFGSHKVNEICLYEMKIDNATNTYKVIESIKL